MTTTLPDTGPRRLTSGPISSKDDLKRFACGEREIDDWAKGHAHRLHSKGRCCVTLFRDRGGVSACGFYSMSMSREAPGKLLHQDDRDAWKDGAPIVYLQYLAVQRGRQGQGIGGVMLVAGLKRALAVHDLVPIYGVGLRSLNQRTTALYQRFGFARAPDENGAHPLMILPIWTAQDLFRSTPAPSSP